MILGETGSLQQWICIARRKYFRSISSAHAMTVLSGIVFIAILWYTNSFVSLKVSDNGMNEEYGTLLEHQISRQQRKNSTVLGNSGKKNNSKVMKSAILSYKNEPRFQTHELSDTHINREGLAENTSLFFRVDLKPVFSSAVEGGPMNYLSNYRNPCWKSTPLSPSDCGLRCLPLVYLVGVTKSGTSDLYENLIKHRDIVHHGHLKTVLWWNRKSLKVYPKLKYPFQAYIERFNKAACEIEGSVNNRSDYHPKVAIDGSSSHLWDYDGWENIPGNKGLSAPKYILPSTLKVMIPNAKIIAILRQPSNRLYSNFLMKTHNTSAKEFHALADEAIWSFNNCLKNNSLRHCTYNRRIVEKEFVRGLFVRASLYYVYIRDWMEYFPQKQFLVLKGEDYYANRTKTLPKVFTFLSLDFPSASVMDAIEELEPRNARSQHSDRCQEKMLPETKELLDSFYAPYNYLLAELLGDKRFLWADD